MKRMKTSTLLLIRIRATWKYGETELLLKTTKLENPNTQIAFSEARKIEPDFEVGEDVSEPVNFVEFSRRAIISCKAEL